MQAQECRWKSAAGLTQAGSRREAEDNSVNVGRGGGWASYECDLTHLPGGCLDLGLPKENL